MADKTIYPKEPIKIVEIKKQGYNALTVLADNADVFKIQLYNPNLKPIEKPEE